MADQNGSGGGIYLDGSGAFTLINSTISNNNGGGIAIQSSMKNTLINSTISDNNGGGILIVDSQVDMIFCTIFGNTMSSNGGGILITHEEHDAQINQVTIRNSIVANNHARIHPDLEGMLTSYGFNLFQDSAGATFLDPDKEHYTDITGLTFTNILIDPQLRYNGGTTPTYALLPNSPAIDKIPFNACHISINIREKLDTPISQYSITTDQRGIKRPQGDACDIGAFEYKPSTKL